MLGALFYPKGTELKPIPFDSLFIPYIYKEIYLEGVYIDVLNDRTDMTIIDVGANIGIVTQYMRDHAKILYALEPSTEHYEALEKNVTYNKWDNVKPFKMALAEKDGEMSLSLNKWNRTCHSLNLCYPGARSEQVRTVCFETFFKENNIKKVDFIKFDVEGYEEQILCGKSFEKVAKKISAIMVEFHFPTFPTIVDHMIKLGYKARRYPSSAVIVLFTR